VPNNLEKRIDIKVGLSRSRSAREKTPRVCIVGIAPAGFPWLSEIFPENRIKVTRMNGDATDAVEQLRFSSKSEQGPLPRVAAALPSRIRDAFRLLLKAGAPEVEILLARGQGLMPWDLDQPIVSDMLNPFLGNMPGAMLVYPDAGGPWPNNMMGLVQNFERMSRLRDTVRNFSQQWQDYYQLGFMDFVQGSPSENRQILLGITGNDVVLCNWTGSHAQIRRHGWRPACAALVGHLAGKDMDLTQGSVGQDINLGNGRYFVRSRAAQLGQAEPAPLDSVVADTCAVLEIDNNIDTAEIASTPTFRRPLGEWNVSSVRTVKLIHQRLVQASDMFVFRPAKEIEATALAANIDLALRPFFDRGIVVGPDGAGPPVVSAGVIRNPQEPGLYVDLMAQVRPWCQHLSVRVMVKMGEQPLIEEK
jgi:hypothetical protein